MFPEQDLWIIPLAARAHWWMRLDWYLNHQIAKAQAHRTQSVAKELQALAKAYEIEVPEIHGPQDPPLLLATQGLCPAQKTLVLPFANDERNWLAQARKLAEGLNCRSICVFLPPGMNAKMAASLWSESIRFVEDEGLPA